MTSTLKPQFCGQCARAGVVTLADYIYQAEETSLAGPLLGDPDCWPPNDAERMSLCEEHFASLTADQQIDYVPVSLTSLQGPEQTETLLPDCR